MLNSTGGFLAQRVATPLAGRRGGGLQAIFRIATLWRSISSERRALGDLDAHLLADIGLDREAAEAEARRPFWRFDAWR